MTSPRIFFAHTGGIRIENQNHFFSSGYFKKNPNRIRCYSLL